MAIRRQAAPTGIAPSVGAGLAGEEDITNNKKADLLT
jgi:hypothetical protein